MPTENIKKKTIISAFSLFFQSGYSAALGLVANLVITILLSPQVYGIYITTLSLISFLNYFSDIGLAASLIQKKNITDKDISTTFTVQQILILSLILIGVLATSFVQSFYKLPQQGVYLYWALLLSFFISSLKTIPSIFLERTIQFQKIVLVQIVESTVFYIAIIILAFMKFNLMSFTFAVILRAVVGLIVIYSISFWKPKIGISRASLKELLSFGMPFQASSFLALFKDDLITLFLSKVLGFAGIGYIGWAKKWAEAPIRIVMDNITRVIFPLIARFQDDKSQINKLMNKVFYYQTALLAPVMMGAVLVISNLVMVIPKYTKWEPALPLFYIFTLSSFLVTYSSPCINLFNALGKVKLSFSFMLLWTALTWILTPLLTAKLGIYGFPITHISLSITFILVIYNAREFIPVSTIGHVAKFIFAAVIMGLAIFLIKQFTHLPPIVFIGTAAIVGGIIYSSILMFVFKIDIKKELRFFLQRE